MHSCCSHICSLQCAPQRLNHLLLMCDLVHGLGPAAASDNIFVTEIIALSVYKAIKHREVDICMRQ